MGILESDIQYQIHQLTEKLESSRLAQRDVALKSTREVTVLKRLVITLCETFSANSVDTQLQLLRLKHELEQQSNLSNVLAKLAMIERIIKQDAYAYNQNQQHFIIAAQESNEQLQQLPQIPIDFRQSIQKLTASSSSSNGSSIPLATKLLQMYEAGLRSILLSDKKPQPTSNFDDQLIQDLNQELQSIITEIDFDGETGEQLADIRARLLLGGSTEDLLKSTLNVLHLLMSGTEYERQSSETFLNQVNGSLSGIKTATQHTLEQCQTYSAHRSSLNEELLHLVEKSQSTSKDPQVTQAQLEGLKTISERFFHTEKKEQALIEQIQYSVSQLDSLTEITEDYRRRMEEQQERIKQDPLTKVLNHSAIIEQVDIEYRKWIRSQAPLKMAIIDIDHFRVINERFGYTAGDKALAIIARTIKETINELGTIGRFAGEKFLLILPNQNESCCYKLLTLIQQKVGSLPFKFRTQSIRISLSIAYTDFSDCVIPEECIEKLMLGLKESKRNKMTAPNGV